MQTEQDVRQSNAAPRLWYFYDALCGWCYGFSPVMQQVQAHYDVKTLGFEVISGGMIRGERIGAIGEVAPYIKRAYKDVEERTGVRFGAGFLEGILAKGEATFTSIPAALAMAAFKRVLPERALDFAHALQRAIYFDGIEPANLRAYGKYAAEFGIDEEAFLELALAPESEERAEAEFSLCAQLGVNGFPTVVFQKDRELTLVAQGFVELETLQERVNTLLSE
jgi:putative protein-disulfide isomerase